MRRSLVTSMVIHAALVLLAWGVRSDREIAPRGPEASAATLDVTLAPARSLAPEIGAQGRRDPSGGDAGAPKRAIAHPRTPVVRVATLVGPVQIDHDDIGDGGRSSGVGRGTG
ncbi:MAG: hypothetical protein NT062_31375, partial [Proteobacteria bacterium]|nr:hypothetical protein [Pseudomonadota bacterium]